jgi:hypothetical protein
MTDETSATEVAATDAVVPEVESSTTPDQATEKTPTDDAGTPEQPRDDKGRFASPAAQKRIDELTFHWREQQRINERLTALLEERQAPKPEVPETPPTLEQHGFDEGKYQQALIAYAEKRAEAKVEEKLRAFEEGQKVKERQQTFQTRAAEFKKATEDYDEVVYNPALAISANMAEDIAESEVGPQLAYYLGKNPDVAREIAALSPRAASRELGKIEARLSAPKAAPAVTKAPPPPPKIAASVPDIEKDPDQMTNDEWKKWRQKQIDKR